MWWCDRRYDTIFMSINPVCLICNCLFYHQSLLYLLMARHIWVLKHLVSQTLGMLNAWNEWYMHMYISMPNKHVDLCWYLGLQIFWYHHQMETFSVSLALREGNPPVTSGLPSQRPVTGSFDIFFDMRLNKWLSKRDAGDLRRHCAHYDLPVTFT